jgi:hypothetical protein
LEDPNTRGANSSGRAATVGVTDKTPTGLMQKYSDLESPRSVAAT